MLFSFLQTSPIYVEIGHSSLRALCGERGMVLALERLENGHLTPRCGEELVRNLRAFTGPGGWAPRRRAYCAIGARGVSVRRWTLPGTPMQDLPSLLRLQVEREFPLNPDAMAWGYTVVAPNALPDPEGRPATHVLVAAVKKETVDEYAALLARAGLNAVFTLAALTRSEMGTRSPGTYSILDIGRHQSELITLEGGAPRTVRILAWGGEDVTQSIARKTAEPLLEAERTKEAWGRNGTQVRPELKARIDAGLLDAVMSLAEILQQHDVGSKLQLTGETARLKDIAPRLAQALGGRVSCEAIESAPGEGRSEATLGLQRWHETTGRDPALILHVAAPSPRAQREAARPGWQWAALALGLALVSLALRYGEPALGNRPLARALAELKAADDQLPKVDRELSFLQYLKTNQPPYLDSVAALASAAPAGTRIDSLSLNRRGDLSLRATMRDAQQVMDFRAKLIVAGLFSTLVIDDQSPSPDRQKLTVRLSGQWKALAERGVPTGPAATLTNLGSASTSPPGTLRPIEAPLLPSGSNRSPVSAATNQP